MKLTALLRNAALLLCALIAPAAAADLAQTLVAMAGGSPNGLCSVPRCGDGSLAVGLAANSGFIVHAMDADTANVAAARAGAGSLLGQRIYVEQGGPAAIPLAAESVDLLVLADMTDADLTGATAAEILRVISPGVGRAILGGPSSSLAQANLDAWVRGFGVSGTVQTNGYGVWGIVRRGPLAGADDWTHPYHGPDMNPASLDTALTLPTAISWLAKPFHANTRGSGSRVSAEGRVFYATGGDTTTQSSASPEWMMRAYNLYNGQLLWERSLNTNTWTHRNTTAVAQGGRLYVLQDASVLVWDAATGADLATISFAGVTGQAKWLGISGTTLVALIGPMDPSPSTAFAFYPQRDSLDLGCGTLLLAYDLTAGQEKWRRDEGARIDHRTFGIAGGKIYYDVPGTRIVCRDLLTGDVVWQNGDPAVVALVGAKKGATSSEWWADVGAAYMDDHPSMLCSANALYIGRPEGKNFVALSPADGHVLWSAARTGGRAFNFVLCSTTGLFVDGVRGGTGAGGLYDPLTGVAGAQPLAGGCGLNSATPKYFVSQGGGITFDLQRMQKVGVGSESVYPLKTECSMGTLVAGGRMVGLAKACECAVIRGGVGFSSGRMYAAATGQLQVASTNSVIAFPTDNRDWTTHRATAQHNGASAASAPLALTSLWHTAPRFPSQVFTKVQYVRTTQHSLTAPLAACGRVFVAASDGLVQSLAATTGAELWRFQADGAVLASPTLADGRLFFGSADGWVYALEAYTGKLLWRYRVGPEDRKIMVYGYLQSSWPVNSGVYYENGAIYVSAALPAQPGAYVCALNATTGALLWRNQDLGPNWDAATGIYANNTYVPAGYLVRAGSRLWSRRYTDGAAGLSFDPATGAKLSNVTLTGNGNSGRGREVGVFGGNFLVVGGPEIYSDNVERGGKNRLTHCFVELGDGAPRLPVVEMFDSTQTMAAWTEARILVASANRTECWDAPAAAAYLHGLIEANGGKQCISRDANAPMLLWGGSSASVFATALSSNLAITAAVTADKTWTTLAGRLRGLDLANGTPAWDIALPNIPQHNGISVDRDGRVLVVLHDGSVAAYGSTYQIAQDTDGDGVPDGWMLQHFGHSSGQAKDHSRAGDDADGDGMTNGQEYQAGTVPGSGASVLRQTVAAAADGFRVQFPTVTGKWYRVEWCADLGRAPWSALADHIPGTGGEVGVTDTAASGHTRRFYRVAVLP